MRTTIISTLVLLFFIFSCSRKSNPVGANFDDPIVIKYLGPSEENSSGYVFQTKNISVNSFNYWAYSRSFPIFQIQTLSDTGWTDQMAGWCGTGLQIYQLDPGNKFEFEAGPWNYEGKTYGSHWRIGISFTSPSGETKMIVWSESVKYAE